MKNNKLLVLGSSFVGRDADDNWVTNVPIADYLNELANYFDGCIWMSQKSDSSRTLKGSLNSNSIKIFPFQRGLEIPINWLRLIFFLRQRPYVILYFPALLIFIPVIPLVKLFSQNLVVYLGNDYEVSLKDTNHKYLGWAALYRFSIEYSLKQANVVIVRGKYLADKVRCFNKNVIETIPLGHINLPNSSANAQNIVENTKRILYLGKLLWSKGLESLFTSLLLLQQKNLEIPILLDVVGDGKDKEAIETTARKLDIYKYIKFHGWIETPHELSSFFAYADVLVVPSSSHPEGVPRVIDEALLQGVPVIATRVGGIVEEFTDDEVMLVEPNNCEDLAECMEAILFNRQVRYHYLAGAKRRTAKWTRYNSNAQQHAHILLNCI